MRNSKNQQAQYHQEAEKDSCICHKPAEPAINDQEELPDCFFVHALRRGIFTLKKHSFHASIFNNMGRVESYIFYSDSANC